MPACQAPGPAAFLLILLALTTGMPVPGAADGGEPSPDARAQRLAQLQTEQANWPRMHFWRIQLHGADAVAMAVPVLERSEGTYWLRVQDVLSWGVEPLDAPAYVHQGEAYVALAALAPLEQRVDLRRGIVHLHLPPERYPARIIGLGQDRVPALSPAVAGGLLNYDLFSRADDDRLIGSGLFEMRAFLGPRAMSHRWLLADAGSGLRSVRLDTALSLDDTERATRLELGDAVARGGSLAPQLRFAGVQFGRDFGIVPQQRNFPLPDFSAVAELPSTVELFINQTRRAREQVPPGEFTLLQPPVVSGAGEAQLVVTDALGRERIFSESFYVNRVALRPGLSDYSLALGVLRDDFGQASDRYDGLLANAVYRLGISARLTGEVFGRLRDERHVVGLGGTTTLLDFASLDAGLSHGGARGEAGWLAQAGLQRSSPTWSFALRHRAAEAAFSRGLDFDAGLRRETFVSAGRSVGRVRLSASGLQRSTRRGSGDFRRIALNASTALSGVSVLLSVFEQHFDARDELGVRLFLVWTPRRGLVASTGLSHSGTSQVQARLSRSVPSDVGTGWRLAVDDREDSQTRIGGEFRHQLAGGAYTLRAERLDGRGVASARADGAVGVVGGAPFASQVTRDALAVVRVGDFAGVPVYRENRLVGHTRADGTLVVPRLRGYQRNRLRIGTESLPLDAQVMGDAAELVPARGSAVRHDFQVEQRRAVQMRLLRAEGRPVPAGARVIIDGVPAQLPVARDGLLYLEVPVTDAVRLTARWNTEQCTARIELPRQDEVIPDLGVVQCE